MREGGGSEGVREEVKEGGSVSEEGNVSEGGSEGGREEVKEGVSECQ